MKIVSKIGAVRSTWLPDETLFSLLSRNHILSGNSLSAGTSMDLFGHPLHGTLHDFPSHLGELTKRSGASAGRPSEIIQMRTILALYLRFRDGKFNADVTSRLTDGGVGGLKMELGVAAGRINAAHPLKACALCMTEDITQFGVAYWHLSHQFPGVWICLNHKRLLLESSVKSNGVERFQYLLPTSAKLREFSVGQCDAATTSLLTKIAQIAVGLSKTPSVTYFKREDLRQSYLNELVVRGLAHPGSAGVRLDIAEIGASYAKFFTPIRAIPEFSFLAVPNKQVAQQAVRILRKTKTYVHPVRHMLMIAWLFDSFEIFLERYSANEHVVPVSSSQQISTTLKRCQHLEAREKELVRLVVKGLSMSAAANLVAVDKTTAMVWLARQGISTARRPKSIDSKARAKIIQAIAAGRDKVDVSEAYGISVSSVTRMMRTEPGLQKKWHGVRFLRLQADMRKKWTLCMRKLAGRTTKQIRATEPAVFGWLYRNDREWLQERSRSNTVRQIVVPKRVDWKARDALLSATIKSKTGELAQAGKKRVTVGMLCSEIPILRAKLSQLHKLPCTKRALDAI